MTVKIAFKVLLYLAVFILAVHWLVGGQEEITHPDPDPTTYMETTP